MLGSRLGSVYAPALIASFGSGDRRIDIRVIAAHGAAAYLSEFKKDEMDRKTAGATLLSSPHITTSAAARAQLTEGKVDTRLLVTIVTPAAAHPVSILGFGDSGPGASPGMPLRSADLVESAARAGTASPAYVRSMVDLLHNEQAPYAPTLIRTVRLADGRPALRVEFAAPSPIGLIGPSTGP